MISNECGTVCQRDDRLRTIEERLERIEMALFGKMAVVGGECPLWYNGAYGPA